MISSHIIETLFHTWDKIAILDEGVIKQIFDHSDFDQLNDFKF